MKHFLKETDFKHQELGEVFALAREFKKNRGDFIELLKDPRIEHRVAEYVEYAQKALPKPKEHQVVVQIGGKRS